MFHAPEDPDWGVVSDVPTGDFVLPIRTEIPYATIVLSGLIGGDVFGSGLLTYQISGPDGDTYGYDRDQMYSTDTTELPTFTFIVENVCRVPGSYSVYLLGQAFTGYEYAFTDVSLTAFVFG
jgi:hypothetical protein